MPQEANERALHPDEYFMKAMAQLRVEKWRSAWITLLRALDGYTTLGDSGAKIAQCHHALGMVFLRLERPDRAVSAFWSSLAVLASLEDCGIDRANALFSLSVALGDTGSTAEAENALSEAGALYLALGDVRRAAMCDKRLAWLRSVL